MAKNRMTPKDFAPHLLAVLADLTEFTANISVPMTETYAPVCSRMGIDEDHGGETSGGYKFTHRNIGLAFRQHIRGKGLGEQVKKGQWMLTDEGVKAARGDDPEDEVEAEEAEVEDLAAARADAAEEIEQEEEIAEIVHLPVASSKHPYSDDPYIVSLAIESVPCFGAWSKRSDACKECPIARDCIVQVGVLKGKIAADLEAEEAEALRREAKRAEEAAKKSSSVSELIDSFGEEDQAPASSRGKSGKFKPQPGQDFAEANATRESVCLQCGEKIHKGEPVKWCADEGIFHVACFEEP